MTSFIPVSSLHQQASHWFDRARAAVLDELPCRRGCSRCCIGTFAITVLDMDELARGMATLPALVRADIVRRAKEQVVMMQAGFEHLTTSPFLDAWSEHKQDDLAAVLAELPCPALDGDGTCGVYAFRPGRMMGIPVSTNDSIEGACEVQIAVPILRVPAALREEEDCLAEREAMELAALQNRLPLSGEEVLLAYGFLGDLIRR